MPTTMTVSLVMNTSRFRDSGVMPLIQRYMVSRQVTNMPKESQNGHAPEPGPLSSIQPMCSSLLFTISPIEHSASSIAKTNSAVRTVMSKEILWKNVFYLAGLDDT